MSKKFKKLSIITSFIALAIFGFTFFLFHFVTETGAISPVWTPEPGKPFVTLLFGIWGVMFLFSSVMCLLISHIFYPENETD